MKWILTVELPGGHIEEVPYDSKEELLQDLAVLLKPSMFGRTTTFVIAPSAE